MGVARGKSGAGESGQSLVFVVVALTVVLGMAALVLDVGSWFRTKRADQAVVDAASLAGAQALPEDPAQAVTLAIQYAKDNGVDLPASDVSISTDTVANDTITVTYHAPARTFFARVFGFTSVDVGAHAAARSSIPGAARFVAPIVVPTSNPMLQCTPPPCGGSTQISLLDLHNPGSGDASGSFALLNLVQNDNGTASASTLAAWMLNGDTDEMPLGTYYAAPSTNFNSGAFQQALQARIGTEVLFPVYKPPIVSSGSNAQFDIVGWVAFHINSETAQGSSGTLVGYFTRYIAQGLPAASLNGFDFGTRVVKLVQ